MSTVNRTCTRLARGFVLHTPLQRSTQTGIHKYIIKNRAVQNNAVNTIGQRTSVPTKELVRPWGSAESSGRTFSNSLTERDHLRRARIPVQPWGLGTGGSSPPCWMTSGEQVPWP